MIGSYGVRSSILLPIHAPSIYIASPSFAILVPSRSGVWLQGPSILVEAALCQCSSLPIGIILVFSLLNFAPDTSHHSSRILQTKWKLSSLLRQRLVLSAKSFIASLSIRPDMFMPFIFGSFLILQARGSMVMLNSVQDSRSPWRTPLLTQ